MTSATVAGPFLVLAGWGPNGEDLAVSRTGRQEPLERPAQCPGSLCRDATSQNRVGDLGVSCKVGQPAVLASPAMGSPREDSTVPGAAQGGTAGPCPPVPGRSETQPEHWPPGRADKRVVGAVGRDEAMPAGCQHPTGSTSSYLGSHTHPARSQMRAGTLCAADCLTDSSGAGGRGFTDVLT